MSFNACSPQNQDCQSDPPSQEVLELSINSLTDTKNAIAIRQSLILAEIGVYIEQITSRLALYHADCSVLLSVNDDIRFIQNESNRREIPINFYGLEHHRSTCSGYGLSFLQEHRSLRIQMQPFLQSTYQLRALASDFLDDPASDFFTRLNSLGRVR